MIFLFQGRWNSKVGSLAKVLVDLRQMIPFNAQRFVDWEQTSTEQEDCPTKILISMWFKSETNLATMVELLRVVKDELMKKPDEVKGQVVKARLELSHQKKKLHKGACFVLQRNKCSKERRAQN